MHLTFAVLLAAAVAQPHTFEARAVVRDFSHPRHAGDFHEESLQATIAVDSDRRAMSLAFGDERFLLRGHELFSVKEGKLTESDGVGDLRATTIPKLDPLFASSIAGGAEVVAHGDELWTIRRDRDGSLRSIETTVEHDLYGARSEIVRYESWRSFGSVRFPSRITVHEGKNLKLQLDVTSVRAGVNDDLVLTSRRDPRSVYDEDVSFREIAPGLFMIELAPTNSRVFVAEFADHLFVIEGAYHDRNVGRIAARIRERFPNKPIRYFSFSHIHGQYLGGVRTYAEGGARVVTTPTGAAAVKEIVEAATDVVPVSRRFEDAANALTMYNVESQHTDDYSIFYFPRAKVLLAGDLLCFRGRETPLRGRSKFLCETLQKLGVEVEQIFATWPVSGYGCVAPAPFEEFRAACQLPSPQ